MKKRLIYSHNIFYIFKELFSEGKSTYFQCEHFIQGKYTTYLNNKNHLRLHTQFSLHNIRPDRFVHKKRIAVNLITQNNRFSGTDSIRSFPTNFSSNSVNEMVRQLNRELLWTEAKDVWCCNLEPVWGDFFGARAVGLNRAIPFLDAFPLTLWVHIQPNNDTVSPDAESGEPGADVHGLAYVGNLISVQINHYQYLFLLRLSEELAEMATYLSVDSNRILKVKTESSLVVGAIVPQVEVTFIMPSQNPGTCKIYLYKFINILLMKKT